ncbi:hypothetical protein BG53_08985 [Paenibacillus darwinianus]|uniref:DUF4190 domain-containing protein n=1 Tax=Paenibacillus darwinianus TaxID=1380763 RepID=A0A9W5W6N0_9BACL|nr:DUF4190 domain-containing protein [Paenibacillus darwinianus]EXX85325.1 hypothetical protein BG53_08985 [Paenibacillus darwinianus]EXX86189.1 hypothetical protein CH50_07740 [Paenibacillus darwinianus]EXX86513.1 hypothetical protein BG52_06280 [Paenibacillus darwinianus]
MDHHYSSEPPNPFSRPQPQPPKTNGKSIAALVLGILSIVIPYLGLIIGIIAIVFSSISLKEIKRSGEQGKGLAIAGLVCGIVGTALYAVIILIVLLAFSIFSSSGEFNYSANLADL